MQALYIASVCLHILAAVTWIGGMLFLVLVVVPWLRRGNRAQGAAFLRETGVRFRTVGWTCFGILIVTGTFNLWMRGVQLSDFVRAEWLGSPFGRSVIYKLATFALVLMVSAVHDFVIGPRAAAAMEEDASSPRALKLRRQASLCGRINAGLAIALVFFAVVIVRGWPY